MNLHIIIGEDDFRVGEAAKKIIGDGVGLEVIDSMNASNAELQLADLRAADLSFSTPPFLDPKKVTWWKNVHFLPGGGRKSSDEDGASRAGEVKEALEKFAKKLASSTLPEEQHFILSGPHLLKTSIFAKTLAGAAEFVVFETEKPNKASQMAVVRAIDMAKDMGLKFQSGAANRFVSVVGTDSRSLMSELGKLRDYLDAGATQISEADIDAISSPGVGADPVPWDLTDAIGRRDIKAALAALKRFEGGSGFAVVMTTVIERFFRQLIDVASGRAENMVPFVLQKNQEFLRHWALNELRVARARFVMLREKVVSGTLSGDVLVVTTLTRVLRRATKK